MTTFIGFPQDGYEFGADEVGAALAGLVVRDENGIPREGVLGTSSPLVRAVPASWQVAVSPFAYVFQEDGSIQISGVSSTEILDISSSTTIPPGQSRIDLVVWDPGAAAAEVLEGEPGASPEEPPVPSDFEILAPVLVSSSDGSVQQGGIQRRYNSTSLIGAELPVANLDQLSGWVPAIGQPVRDLSRGIVLTWNGTSWDGEWVPLTLINSFLNAAGEEPAAYRIIDGRIEFRGMLKRASATTSWTRPFVLPGSVTSRLPRFSFSIYSGTSSLAGFVYRPSVSPTGPEVYGPAFGTAGDLGVPLSSFSVALKAIS